MLCGCVARCSNKTGPLKMAVREKMGGWALLSGILGRGGFLFRRNFVIFLAGAAVLASLAAAAFFTANNHQVLGGAMAFLAVAALLGLAWEAGRRHAGPVAGLMLDTFKTSPQAQLIATAEGDVIYANKAFRQLFTAAASLDFIAATLGGAAQATKDFDRLRASARAGLAGKCDLPLRLSPSEPPKWRRVSVAPFKSNPRFVVWLAEDVTAQRELEEARLQEENILVDYVNHLPAGFFSVDENGRMLFANHTLSGWLGVPANEISKARPFFSDFVVSSAAVSDLGFAKGGGGDSNGRGEVVIKTADGGSFHACLVQTERNEGRNGLNYTRSLVLRELAWRRKEPEGDAAPARRLHWLFDAAPVGIVMLDLSGEVSDCNRAFLKMIGLHRDAVVGRPFSDRITREDRSEAAAQISKVVMGASQAAALDVRMPVASEKEMVATLYASRTEDEDGEVSGLVLHFVDTTEQKDLEVQFAQSQKMQAVGHLAGGVAHDFNNLLTAMIGFCDLLLERHGPRDPSFSDIMQIKQNANRAANLVRQMLAFSRKQTLKPKVLNVSDALSDLSNLLGRLIGETIELDFEHGVDLLPVKADPGQFDQVVVNLAVNARDAMKGGGALRIRSSNVTLEEPAQRGADVIPEGGYVLIEVSDTGHGISKENLPRIFDPFFTTKGAGAGTGLGLSTVYGIVRQSGGYIVVDSAPGEGSTFGIYLPCYGEDAQPEDQEAGMASSQPSSSAAAPDLTGHGTILLVEDEDAVRLFGVRALKNKGYDVLEAADGEAALDVINTIGRSIDLIISDVVMPGMDGHTLIQLVRQEYPTVKVILMSGYAEDALSESIQNDSSVHFLGKPYTLKELAGMVKKVMEY